MVSLRGCVQGTLADDGETVATRLPTGGSLLEAGCQMTAITRSHGMTMVVRNMRVFADAGIVVMDPWTDA